MNTGRKTIEIFVQNHGDRPIQVGSHFHFFEVNRALRFMRNEAFGMRLDIPSGTAVRFEPGEEKRVQLVEIGGLKIVHGLNGLTNGPAIHGHMSEEIHRVLKQWEGSDLESDG